MLNIADSRHFPLYITADSHDYLLYIWRKVIKRKTLKNRSAIYIADSRHCPLYNMAGGKSKLAAIYVAESQILPLFNTAESQSI